jgi:hypothetical protein
MPRFVQTLKLHATVARRVVRRYGINPRGIVARLDERAEAEASPADVFQARTARR